MSSEEADMREILRLTKENNRMLRGMRRTAFWGGVIKIGFYVLVLVVAPLWIYTTYLAPVLEELQGTYRQIQDTSERAGAQLTGVEDFFQQIQNLLPTSLE